MSVVEVVPITWKQTQQGVAAWHRHLSRGLTGCRFAAGLSTDGTLVAVACAGTPARAWNEQRKIAITRVSVKPGTSVRDNSCSRLYGALCRAAEALGYTEAWTYTLPGEPGTSLKASGFEDMGLTDGGEWDRPSRRRGPAANAQPKRRWRRFLGRKAKPWTTDVSRAIRSERTEV